MNNAFDGLYINLDRAVERRRTITRNIRELGLESYYQRLAAVDGREEGRPDDAPLNPGEYGCLRSHIKALQRYPDDSRHLHILEDDALLTRDLQRCVLSDGVSRILLDGRFDIVFTECAINYSQFVGTGGLLEELEEAKKKPGKHFLAPAHKFYAHSLSSYFVNGKSKGALLKVAQQSLAEGTTFDLHLKSKIRSGEIKAAITVPFLTSLTPHSSDSSIQGQLSPDIQVGNYFRPLMSRGADFEELVAELRGLNAGASWSPGVECYLELLRFALRDGGDISASAKTE